MSFIYTRSELKSRINAGIQGKVGMLISAEDTMNEAVRRVGGKVALRSRKRSQALTPNLFNSVYEYTCPADLDSIRIIDIPAQAKRHDGEFFLVPSAEFEVLKGRDKGMIAIDDANGVRTLKVVSAVDSKLVIISELDSLTSGASASWSAFGDGTNLAADTDDFIKGAGSLSWDISAAGGTTAGIQNSSLNTFDLTDYLGGNGAVFVWHKINSVTNVTNYILRIGSSSGNYYQKTITTRHDGTAFVAGWNLLRFDLTSLTTVGTPDDDAGAFAAIYMTKTAGKVSETDYKFDYLALMKGVIHNVSYYSNYGWTTSAGVYIENSSDDSNLLVANSSDEFDLVITAGRALAAREIDDDEKADKYEAKFINDYKEYQQKNPDESKIMTNEYHNYK